MLFVPRTVGITSLGQITYCGAPRFVLRTIYCGRKIKEAKMHVERMEWKADTILAGKLDAEILRRPGCRWEDNIKTI